MIEPDLLDHEVPRAKKGHVWITRGRLDTYFVAGTALCLAVAVWSWTVTGERRFLGQSFTPLLWWTIFRWFWPRGGDSVPRLSCKPGTLPLLAWFGLCGIVGCVGVAFLSWLGGMPHNHEPWHPRQVLATGGFLVGWFGVLLLGGTYLERRFTGTPRSDNPLR